MQQGHLNSICAFDSTFAIVTELLALSKIFRVVAKPGCGPWACPALLRWSSEKGERVRVLTIHEHEGDKAHLEGKTE